MTLIHLFIAYLLIGFMWSMIASQLGLMKDQPSIREAAIEGGKYVLLWPLHLLKYVLERWLKK